ncbi:hypothetical protein D3C74_288700 [compost metagenome]
MNKAKMTFRFDEHGREDVSGQNNAAKDSYVNHRHYIAEPSGHQNADEGEEHWKDRSTPSGMEENNSPYHTAYRAVDHMEDWGDPFTDYTGTGGTVIPSYLSPPYSVRPTRTSWWKVAGSLTGAIVTGALFGFVVLSLFNQEVTIPIPGFSNPTEQSAEGVISDVPVLGPISELSSSPDERMEVAPVLIDLPAQTYHFLQYGVFSSAAGVELAQKELQDSGIAAARDDVDKKRVYAGVSTDREQAKLLSSQLKSVGVNLILHEITLPSTASVEYDGDKASLELYLAQSAELVKLLSSSSASLLVESEPAIQSPDEIKALRESHQLWTESAAIVRGHLSLTKESDANEMEKAVNSAVVAMGEYNKKGAKTLLWEVQNEMMRFIMAQQRMLQ